MSKPFEPVTVAEFERMSAAEREKYIDALIEHLQAIRRVPPAQGQPKKRSEGSSSRNE